MINYQKLMKRCIKLALKADGKTSPNPLVGALIVNDNGEILSEGYHKKAGEPHAEVNAINNCKESLEGKILVVNLEPCCHYGKTPPCCDLIIEKGIKKVVVGSLDSNPLVAGNGVKKLQNAGIEVEYGILSRECEKLNEIFFTNQNKDKIYVATKIASTIDGKIALSNGVSKWITSEKARKEVQKIRNRYDAILTSSNTVLKDNPSLTCRMKKGQNPTRILLDKDLKVPLNYKIFNDDNTNVLVFTNKKYLSCKKNVIFVETPLKNSYLDLQFVLNKLYEKNIKSVLVEAGGRLNGAFLKENLIDKIYYFIASKIFSDSNAINSFYGENLRNITNSKNFKIANIKKFPPDIMLEMYPNITNM